MSNKWFAAILTVEMRKIGIDKDGEIEVVNLKETPEIIAGLIDNKKYFPCYHMNKKHWYTLCLDGSVTVDELCVRIDRSYKLVSEKQKNIPKKKS